MTSVYHSFDTALATRLGSIELAILIHHFSYWIDFNKRAGKNLYDGKYWMYQSVESMANHFPYWSTDQVKRYIKKLVDLKVIIKGNHNQTPFDRTVWYAFHDDFAKCMCIKDLAFLGQENLLKREVSK